MRPEENREVCMQQFWEARYAEDGYAYGTEPNEFLVSQAHRLRPGMRALAVGDGEGRNGVWLARQGLEVLSVDYSAEGLAKARRLAARHGVTLRTEQADLTTWAWPRDAYDLVACIFVHFPPADRPRMHRAMLQALAPGGLVILTAYHKEQLAYGTGGPPVEEMLYTEDMLREDFAAAELLHLEHATVELHEGKYHDGISSVLRLVARRP